MQIIISLFGFIFAVGVLTAVHEFGHFWVARRCGIKVLRFSIGFGRPIFAWHDKLGTEYVISILPLGGYLKMLDENEGPVQSNERHMAYNVKSVWMRMAVISAGSIFNILFAVLIYWLIFVNGITSVIPVLGTVPKGSIANIAGLKKGQEIIQVGDQETTTWEQISASLMPYIGEKGFVKFKVKEPVTKTISSYTLDLNEWAVSNDEGDLLKSLGLEPYDPTPPIVGRLLPDLPASKSGLIPDDLIISVDGIPTPNRTTLINYIRTKTGTFIDLQVKRDEEIFTITIKPISKLIEGGDEVGFIGIEFLPQPLPQEMLRVNKLGIIDGLVASFVKTKNYIVLTLQFLYKIVVGKVSIQHIAGPISIAKYAGQTALSGLTHFLSFLALISISLGVLNMLPIPMLDGGYFTYYLYELLTGKPVPIKAMVVGKILGIIFLCGLMLLALTNDILR